MLPDTPHLRRETARRQREALGATVKQMRERARVQFTADVETLIEKLRVYADDAGSALGEISLSEAWDGVGTLVRDYVNDRNGRKRT